jgi:hypothetical protein
MRIEYRSLSVVTAILLGACAAYAPDDVEKTGTKSSVIHADDGDENDDHNGTCASTSRDCTVRAPVVATGIPGAGAICQIGAFHRGSPIHDKPEFVPFTAPGAALNGDRLLVASTSNYGAPLGNAGEYEGSVLSIDPNGAAVAVPSSFAAAGGQTSTAGGRIQVYTANNVSFLNSHHNPTALTANEPMASLPLGISLNSGNGRPWIANAPRGAAGDGTISVLDPNGAGLAGPPSAVAGGSFAGNITNRNASTTHGLTSGAIGTAIFTKSSDGTRRAVFAALEADGSVVQVHVQKGVDGLVPPGTLTPFTTLTPTAAESTDENTVTRAGLAFNWVPNRVLYVAEPKKNRIAAFDITDDGTLFHASAPRYLMGGGGEEDSLFDIPVDVAPTVPEVASENFSSNTTLAGGADLYVLNRGNNTVLRVTQEGKLIARRKIRVDGQPSFRANGLGVSPDGTTLWVTGQTQGRGGVVVKIAGFGSGRIMPGLMAQAATSGASSTNALGGFFFNHVFTVNEGVGPLFNARSCDGCHAEPIPGGMSTNAFDTRVRGSKTGPVARSHSIEELGRECDLETGIPSDATASSRRSTMTLRSTSLIDFVMAQDMRAVQTAQPAPIKGKINLLSDGRIGKFGWKANVATLIEFMGEAYRNEQGLTNGLIRQDQVNGCGANTVRPELDAVPLVTVAAFLTTVDAPAPTATTLALPGKAVFDGAGCSGCHTPSYPGPGFAAFLYSDLLLHDMGSGLADNLPQESATGSEFRTMTLVKLSERTHFLHDGRAFTPTDAIRAHGGQGAAAAAAFDGLSASDRDRLLFFLSQL